MKRGTRSGHGEQQGEERLYKMKRGIRRVYHRTSRGRRRGGRMKFSVKDTFIHKLCTSYVTCSWAAARPPFDIGRYTRFSARHNAARLWEGRKEESNNLY